MVLSCIDTIEVILSDTGTSDNLKNLRRWVYKRKLPVPGLVDVFSLCQFQFQP